LKDHKAEAKILKPDDMKALAKNGIKCEQDLSYLDDSVIQVDELYFFLKNKIIYYYYY
jgi:hypothetical protein